MLDRTPKQIALENFEGPLDLLLYLVRKGELDIYDVLIQQITNQLLEIGDAESLIPTATLLLIKSEALLSKSKEEEEESEEVDPNFELIHHVADYCRFRHAAQELVSLESDQSKQFTRGTSEPIGEGPPPSGLHHLSLADLSSLFEGVMERAAKNRPGTIKKEEWSVGRAMDNLRKRIKEESRVDFYTLFSPELSRGSLISTFLGLLELVKLGELVVFADSEKLYITGPNYDELNGN